MSTSIAFSTDNKVFISESMGTLSDPDNLSKYRATIDATISKFSPSKILCDLHPGYPSTRIARELSEQNNIPLQQVQHHIAHAHSAAFEHSLTDFVGIAADGMGYGTDGTIWGGEVFDNRKRVGSLEPQLQLGGDSATQFPEKMLVSVLANFLEQNEISKHVTLPQNDLSLLLQQREQQFNSPISTSTGRILDAASALLGFCKQREYPGSPAIILEQNSTTPYDLEPVIQKKDRTLLLTTPIFEFLIENRDKDNSRLAATVQQYLAEGFYKIADRGKPIVFSGGCANNKIMAEYLSSKNVMTNKNVPPGDGGISLGQLCLADSGD